MVWSSSTPSSYWVAKKHFRVSQPSTVTYSQKSHINNTGECEPVSYLNYEGDRADGRNSPAAVELQTPYREMGRMLHTDCCIPCTAVVPCDSHLMMLLQILLVMRDVWTRWLDTKLGPPLKGTAWFSTREKARQECEMLVEEQVNCLERTHRSFKTVEVENYF